MLSSPIAGAATDPVMRVGVDAYPPYVFREGDQVAGLDVELLSAMAHHFGFEIEWYAAPWKRLVADLRSGRIDALTTFSRTEARTAFAVFLDPHYMIGDKVFYIASNSALEIKRAEDLRGLRIAMERGSVHFEPLVVEIRPRVIEVDSSGQLFQMTLAGRADGFVGTETVMDYELKEAGLAGEFRKAAFRIDGTKGFIALSKAGAFADRKRALDTFLRDYLMSEEWAATRLSVLVDHKLEWRPIN